MSRRERAEALEEAGAPAAERAEAWLAVAEAEPCFRWRTGPVRAALDRAGAALRGPPTMDRPDLDARAALRCAMVELADDDGAKARELADVATVAAQRSGDRARALLARIIAARAALRDAALVTAAVAELEALAAEIAQTSDDGLGAQPLLEIELGAVLAIGFGEQRLAALDLEGAREAYERAEEIVGEAPADALPDARFAALQGSALSSQLTRSTARAADRLRQIIMLVNPFAAQRDELEARIALGHMLTLLGKHDEAVRHLDLARTLAKACAGVDERVLAAQSAALAALHAKRYGRALDRAFEALELAGLEKRELASYAGAVSLIAEIHLARGRPKDAYLALVYAAAAVKQRLGPQATTLIDAQIEELKGSLGPERFEAICEEILRDRAARAREP